MYSHSKELKSPSMTLSRELQTVLKENIVLHSYQVTYLLQCIVGCFLLGSPIKIQYSTSCCKTRPLFNRRYNPSKIYCAY